MILAVRLGKPRVESRVNMMVVLLVPSTVPMMVGLTVEQMVYSWELHWVVQSEIKLAEKWADNLVVM
jgi:hypothetical protein